MYPSHAPLMYQGVLLSIETELSHFRSRHPLLCNRELRSIARPFLKRFHPYQDISPIDSARAATPGPSQLPIAQPDDDVAEGESGDICKLLDSDADGLIPKPSG